MLPLEKFEARLRLTLIENGIPLHAVRRRGDFGCDIYVVEEGYVAVHKIRISPKIADAGLSEDEIEVLLVYRAVKRMKAN